MRGCDDEIKDFCLTAKWENGDATPDLDHLIKLAEMVEVSLDELILGKKPEKIVEQVNVEEDWKPWEVKNGWEFLARFWWIPIPILGFLSWFIPYVFG